MCSLNTVLTAPSFCFLATSRTCLFFCHSNSQVLEIATFFPCVWIEAELQPLLRCSLWKNPGQWMRWAWSRPMWLACSPVGDMAYMQLRQNALGIVLLPSNKPPPSICRWWFAEDYNLATFCWIFMRTVNDTSLSLHWPLPHFETVPHCTLVELH